MAVTDKAEDAKDQVVDSGAERALSEVYSQAPAAAGDQMAGTQSPSCSGGC